MMVFIAGSSMTGVPMVSQVLIRHEREDNRRHRRISASEEKCLIDAASPELRPLIVIALDTGLRRGEMLAMRWADVDARPGGCACVGRRRNQAERDSSQSQRLI